MSSLENWKCLLLANFSSSPLDFPFHPQYCTHTIPPSVHIHLEMSSPTFSLFTSRRFTLSSMHSRHSVFAWEIELKIQAIPSHELEFQSKTSTHISHLPNRRRCLARKLKHTENTDRRYVGSPNF